MPPERSFGAAYDRIRELTLGGNKKRLPANANLVLLSRLRQVVSTGIPIMILRAPQRPIIGGSTLRGGAFDYLAYIVSFATRQDQFSISTIAETDHSFANRAGRTGVLHNAEAWLNKNFGDPECAAAPSPKIGVARLASRFSIRHLTRPWRRTSHPAGLSSKRKEISSPTTIKGDDMTTATTTPTSTVTWKIDPAHSHAEFKVKHMMISNVKGSFSNLSGTLVEDTIDPARSRIEATIDISTISTGDEKRDGHLKSPDFFHLEQHPVMMFKSTKVEKKGAEEYAVTGDLTLHGITKPVTFAVEGPSAPGKDPWGNTRIGLSATTKINRKDFGLSWNTALEAGGVLVGEDVQIVLDVQLIKT